MDIRYGVSIGNHTAGLLRAARLNGPLAYGYGLPCTLEGYAEIMRERGDYRPYDDTPEVWQQGFELFTEGWQREEQEAQAELDGFTYDENTNTNESEY